MRVLAASFIILVSIALFSGCGDSATEISGTLPVVTGIAVDTIESKGDTIVVTWDELTDINIDGYFLWFRVNAEDPWMLVNAVVENAAVHIADRSAYYTVMAYYGNDTSMDIGLSDNTNTESLSEIVEPASKPLGFRIDTEGDSLISGDPSSLEFHQQFTIAVDRPSGNRFVFQGVAHPEIWPGGAETMVSSSGGFVAPDPDDSALWQDSILFGGDFFLALETGYYCRLNGLAVSPDIPGDPDTLNIDGQFQPLAGIRVFNQTW